MKNRVFAILISLVLMMSVLPATAMAAEIVDSGKCGDDIKWEVSEDGTLTISGKGRMTNFSSFDGEYSPWREYAEQIETVVIEKGIENIIDYEFANEMWIKSIYISETVTEISDVAFYNCGSLEEIIVSENNPNFSIDENGVLYNKDKSVLVYCPPRIKGAIIIPETVEKITATSFYNAEQSRVFGYIKSEPILKFTGDAPEFDRSTFTDCSVTIYYPVSNISWYNMKKGAKWEEGSQVTWMTYDENNPDLMSFGECGENATFTLKFDGEMIISGEGAIEAAYQPGMKTVVIEEGITEISDYAFENCNGLESITIPASVAKIGSNVFEKCNNLKNIRFAEGNQYYSYDDRRVLFNQDKTVLIDAPSDLEGSYTIPEGVIEIEKGAFNEFPGLTGLTEIIIPESVREIGEYAFQYCSSLTEVTIPKGVTKIGDCAFVCCRKLSKVTIPDTVRDIGVQAFTSCDNLTEIIVDENNPNYSSGNGALLDKEKRTLIEVPAGIREYKVPESVTVIGKIAFINCYALEEVRFKGDSPKFEGSEHNLIFHKDGLTIRYPKNGSGWNETIENCQTCDYDTVTWKSYIPISSLGWICIAAAGVVVLSGIGFGTYKLIKKRKAAETEREAENEK